MTDENATKPKLPVPPSYLTDQHMVQFDEDCWGPLKWQSFERETPKHPWIHIGSAMTEGGAMEILTQDRGAPTTLVERVRAAQREEERRNAPAVEPASAAKPSTV